MLRKDVKSLKIKFYSEQFAQYAEGKIGERSLEMELWTSSLMRSSLLKQISNPEDYKFNVGWKKERKELLNVNGSYRYDPQSRQRGK